MLNLWHGSSARSKSCFLCLFPIAWLAFAPTLLAADRVAPSERVIGFVNVREAASMEADVVGELRKGQRAELLERVPRWYRVRLEDGTEGFVSKSWTRVEKELVARRQDELRIHFLNIGAGTCTVVECPGPDAPPMMVDCGSLGGTDDDMSEEDAAAYVRGVLGLHDEAPNVVISHADSDHYGFIPVVLEDIDVANIWQGGDPSQYSERDFPEWIGERATAGSTLHRDFATGFHNGGEPVGDDLSCGEADAFVLTANVGSSRNSKSLVLAIEYKDFVAVFTGDAEGTTESDVIRNFPDGVKANVLSGSHHGASTHGSNGADWARETAPEVTVFSSGNRFFHPRCDSVERYENTLAGVRPHDVRCGESGSYRPTAASSAAEYVTEINGRIVVTSSGESPFSLHCSRGSGCGIDIPH